MESLWFSEPEFILRLKSAIRRLLFIHFKPEDSFPSILETLNTVVKLTENTTVHHMRRKGGVPFSVNKELDGSTSKEKSQKENRASALWEAPVMS